MSEIIHNLSRSANYPNPALYAPAESFEGTYCATYQNAGYFYSNSVYNRLEVNQRETIRRLRKKKSFLGQHLPFQRAATTVASSQHKRPRRTAVKFLMPCRWLATCPLNRNLLNERTKVSGNLCGAPHPGKNYKLHNKVVVFKRDTCIFLRKWIVNIFQSTIYLFFFIISATVTFSSK